MLQGSVLLSGLSSLPYGLMEGLRAAAMYSLCQGLSLEGCVHMQSDVLERTLDPGSGDLDARPMSAAN